MGLSEKEICIKCNKGGEVLPCADSFCPIAVHVRCMDCPARFDDSGKFYCPFCLYRETVASFRHIKVRVKSTKQALSTFLVKEVTGNNKQVPSIVSKSTCDQVDKPLPEEKDDVPQSNSDQHRMVVQQIHSCLVDTSKVTAAEVRVLDTSKVTAAEVRVLETGNRARVNDLLEIGEVQLEKSVEDRHQDGHFSNSCPAEEEKSGNEVVLAETERNSVEIADERIKVDEATSTFINAYPSLQQNSKSKRSGETRDSTFRESSLVSALRKCGKRVKKLGDEHVVTDSPRRLTRASTALLENRSVKGKLVLVKESSMLPVKLPSGKRKGVIWRLEEEVMLEEGVQKFSITANKNIPWRKILEFGIHVFDGTRTPTDLKEKWKRMRSK